MTWRYIFFHRILQTNDGKIFAIGEGYKRVADAVGIGLTALSAVAGGYNSANSTTKIKITDMVMMQFDNKFDVVNAQIYDKNSNSMNLMGGDFMSAQLLAYQIKYVY